MVVWQENDLYFLEIKVQPSLAPVSFRGKYYVRRGSVTIELNGYELSSLILRRYGLTWDMVIDERITDNDIDKDTVKQFISLAVDRLPSLKFETGSKLILKKLNLIDGKYYKRAALLLFGKNPQKYYPQAILKIGKFLDPIEMISTELLEGNLFQQTQRAIDILTTKYLLRNVVFEGIHRREVLEYPYGALREAILNALIHREYNSTSAIQIKIYPGKLVVLNEGKMPKEVSILEQKWFDVQPFRIDSYTAAYFCKPIASRYIKDLGSIPKEDSFLLATSFCRMALSQSQTCSETPCSRKINLWKHAIYRTPKG